MRWTTLRQERGQEVSDFSNNFHTLCTKLGIKVSRKPVQATGKLGSQEDKEGHWKMVRFPQKTLAQHRRMSLKIVIGGKFQRQVLEP
jgi:hypothetical protein